MRLICTVCFFIFLTAVASQTNAQCTSPISSFPYSEDFEVSNGGWTTGGTNSDWAYGTPNKSVITSALSSKCWIVGGLSGNAYNNNELAWVKSPCFNFTNNPYPYIKFKVFWESEKKFDGALLQYSIDAGITWVNVGSTTDALNCLNANWYNYTPVKYLTPPASGTAGWSGSIASPAGCASTGGSGAWVIAQHTIPALAGKPSVIFRFLFGAGTTCNNFNGFAFDDVLIDIAPPNNADYTFACTNSNTVSFTNTSSLCPALLWDFGDNNTANTANPIHTFSAPGVYNVSLTAIGPGNAPSTIIKQVTIVALTTSVVTPITCFGGNDGFISVTPIPSTGPYIYSWNTSPMQNSQTAINVNAGTYTVTVSGSNTCLNTASILLAPPATVPAPIVTITHPACNGTTGIISITNLITGFMYSFDDGATFQSNPVSPPLMPGTYNVKIKNAAGCVSSAIVAVINTPPAAVMPTFSTISSSVCVGDAILPLPTVSLEGITGTWSPALNNTISTQYQFTPAAGQCAAIPPPVTIVVNPKLTPTINCGISTASSVTFTWVAVAGATGYNVAYQVNGGAVVNVGAIGNVLQYYLSGLAALDSVSITLMPTGPTGTCFARGLKVCSATACPTSTATISYNTPFCRDLATPHAPSLSGTGVFAGGVYSAMPAGLTINSITGFIIASTSIAGTFTVTYTLAASGGCASVTANALVTVSSLTKPTFLTIPAICTGGVFTLPALSQNGITGSWSPAINNALTTTYTFTPAEGQCADTTNLSVQVFPLPTITASDVVRCNAGPVSLAASSNGSLQWYSNVALTNLVATGNTYNTFVNNDTVFFINSRNSFGCSRVKPLAVTTKNTPLQITLGNSAVLCPGKQLILSPGSFARYSWQDNSALPTYVVAKPGTYSVTVTNNAGCTGFSSINIVTAYGCDDIYFPNTFTPNGDTQNDYFGPAGSNLAAVSNYLLSIYNRWGQLVFSSGNPFQKWDGRYKGKETLTGNFVWYATYKFKSGLLQFKKGSVMLVK